MTNEQATAKSAELNALRALDANVAWQMLRKRISDAHERHLLGLSDRSKTPEERSQHVEAYHLANDLKGYVPDRIARLENELREFVNGIEVVDSRVVDALQ